VPKLNYNNLFLSESEQTVKKLFDDHFHHLVLSAFRYLNDYNQSEDIVQDVYVKVWQNFDQVCQIEDLKGYLFKAVRNSCLNYLKHVKVREKFVDNSEKSDYAMAKSPEELHTEEETKIRVSQAIIKLPENWKEAFILSKYDNLKYHEIANEMNISQKTVEKYISKALYFLRNELKDLILLSFLILDHFFKK
jgi:RNA polymerase sigma-70 factor, ECF subfamily